MLIQVMLCPRKHVLIQAETQVITLKQIRTQESAHAGVGTYGAHGSAKTNDNAHRLR